MLHQIKTPQFYTDLGLLKTVLNPLADVKIQGLFKAFECFSSTFQGKFYFQGLFKTVLYIQVLFKPVQTLEMKIFKAHYLGTSGKLATLPMGHVLDKLI